MDDIKLTVASGNEPLAITCPKCARTSVFVARELLRGLTTICPGCGSIIRTDRDSTKPYNSGVIEIGNELEKVRVQAVQRIDGIWFFLDEDEAQILKSLDHDSDRAVAVIVASMIESRLERAIKARLATNDPKIREKLFRTSAPLGTFSVKIDLAYLMGILSKAGHADLVRFKDIRNDFAHDLHIRNFETQSIRDSAANLSLIEDYVAETELDANGQQKYLELRPDAKPVIYALHADQRKKVPRERYLLTAQLMTVRLAPSDLKHYPLPLI